MDVCLAAPETRARACCCPSVDPAILRVASVLRAHTPGLSPVHGIWSVGALLFCSIEVTGVVGGLSTAIEGFAEELRITVIL